MIRLYPEQIEAHLRQDLRGRYLLCGNEPLLLQECQDAIRRAALQQGFNEQHRFLLDNAAPWEEIFSVCRALSLFSHKQMLLLQLPDSGVSAAIGESLVKLSGLLHQDILLLVCGPKVTKAQEKSAWFTALAENGAYVNCHAPEAAQLPHWVNRRAREMDLHIDEPALQLLCYCYEGNLLALTQALQRLALIYPDGKLTLPRVESAVNDAAHFTPYHWLDALLAGKSRRAWHILQQLRLAGSEPLILLRTLQRELLLLLQIKREMPRSTLREVFDRHKVWQNRRPLLSSAAQRLSSRQLGQAITLLTHLELVLKQAYGLSVWDGLEALSMLLCGKPVPESMLHAG